MGGDDRLAVSNRSLERGLAILDCFKPGVDVLAHRDLCEQTGLPKATVTRLVRTLCDRGYLVPDPARGGYGLGVPILSLARALVLDHALLEAVSPQIHRVAERLGSMVGFGTAHGFDIVYLDGTNRDETRPSRRIGQGTRIPILGSAIGHAWLAGLGTTRRAGELARLRRQAPGWRPGSRRMVEAAVRDIARAGFCAVPYNEGNHVAIGAPVHLPGGAVYALNIAYPVRRPGTQDVPGDVADALRELVACAQRPPPR